MSYLNCPSLDMCDLAKKIEYKKRYNLCIQVEETGKHNCHYDESKFCSHIKILNQNAQILKQQKTILSKLGALEK